MGFMAPPQGQPGQPQLGPGAQQTLASMLAQTGPPDNPQTQVQRTNPQYKWLSMLHSIRKSIDECIAESLDDRTPEEQVLVTAMRHATDRLIHGVGGAEASLKLASESLESFAPDLAAQAQARLTQMTAPPTIAGGAPLGGGAPGMPGFGQQQSPVAPGGTVPGAMQPPVPPQMAGISAG